MCVEPLRLSRVTSGQHKSPHLCQGEIGEAELSPTVRTTRWPTDESTIPEPQGHTFATPGPDARRIDNQRRQRRSLGFSRPGVPPGLASHIASRGPEFPMCARKGRRYPPLNRQKGDGLSRAVDPRRRTHPSRRPRAQNKRSIDMIRRRIRHISRRTCPRNEAPPLPVETSSFVRPLRAWGFDEPLLDRSWNHPADGPQNQHVHNVFGVCLRQPVGVLENQHLQFNHQPCSSLTTCCQEVMFH